MQFYIENTFVFFTVTNKNTLLKYIRSEKKVLLKISWSGFSIRGVHRGWGYGDSATPRTSEIFDFYEVSDLNGPPWKEKVSCCSPYT